MASSLDGLIMVAMDLDFDCWIEHHDGRVWVHHNVFKWTHQVFRRVKKTLDWLQDYYGQDLWVCDNDYDKAPNLPRYLKALGFKVRELIPHDGMVRTTFSRKFL